MRRKNAFERIGGVIGALGGAAAGASAGIHVGIAALGTAFPGTGPLIVAGTIVGLNTGEKIGRTIDDIR